MVEPGENDGHAEAAPSDIPWRRVVGLVRPMWRPVALMVGLSVAGVLIGLVPPLALGQLVDGLTEKNDTVEAAVLATVIGLSIVFEASAYILSDGMYARNAGRLYRNLRLQMFAGAARRARSGEDTTGLPSLFISDAETLERITLTLLDSGGMLLVEFVSAVIAMSLLESWSGVVAIPLLAGTWFITRRMQEPAARAGERRQEELEAMTNSITRELERNDDPLAAQRFKGSTERLMRAETRLGWLMALNLQGSGGLARLGPFAVVVAAALIGTKQVGTLIALYLLAQRVFWSFDGLVDLSLGMHSVRGPVARCFDLIDTPERELEPAAP